jgi:diadenosine tetraphosphate (Ap4A) HIT family hydrolase
MKEFEMADCVICKYAQERAYTVFENEHWIVRHSNETNIAGYVLVEPRRHFLDLSDATPEEAASYGEVLGKAMHAVREVTQCERIYTFSLGESVAHYHLHVIPRAAVFPRAYRARGIMQYPLTPTVDQSILEFTTERLRRSIRCYAASR